MNEFYKQIDILCKRKGITHKELAEEIGITQTTLSRYLRMKRTINIYSFMRICKIFDILPETLYKTYLYASLEARVNRYKEANHD